MAIGVCGDASRFCMERSSWLHWEAVICGSEMCVHVLVSLMHECRCLGFGPVAHTADEGYVASLTLSQVSTAERVVHTNDSE
eukprot:6237075-Prymnesium_polylepis.1